MDRRARIDPLDAARGCAMVLVCFSHIKRHFETSAPAVDNALALLTRPATPTFLLLSGLIAGYLLRNDPQRRVAVTLVDRGLFLLIVAHVLLGLADVTRVSLFEWLFVRTTITDAIGIALCLAVLFRAASFGMLVTLGVGVYLVSWLIAMTAQYESAWANHLGAVLFNMRSASGPLVDIALLPYLAVFLLGMALSRWLQTALNLRDDPLIARRLLVTGAFAVSAAVAGALGWYFFKGAVQAEHVADLVRGTLDPRRKFPPSPAYLLFYGGSGVLLAGWFFLRRPAALVDPIVRHASVIGRASLMCFVLQDWLLFVAPRVFGYETIVSPLFWMVYCVLVVAVLYAAAAAWGRAHGNRFLTIGLKHIARRRRAQRTAGVAPEAQSGRSYTAPDYSR